MSLVVPRTTLVLLAVIVVLLAAGVVSAVYLPRARIEVAPAKTTREASQEIQLSTATTEPDFVHFMLPARLLEKTVTESTTTQRTGGEATPDFARGTVTLKNDQAEEQPLLPKTHLRHEATGVFFLTDTAVRIPPQGSVAVAVTAKEAGLGGNVPAGKFIVDKLPASLQELVYAESSTATSGGEVYDVPLTEADVTSALAAARETASVRAQSELTAELGGAPVDPRLVSIEVEEEQASAAAGSRATSFAVTVRVRVRAFVVDTNDLLSLTLLALRSHPQPDEEFVQYDPDSFRLELLQANFERGEARVRGHLTGTFARKTEPALFDTGNLAGRNAAEVREYYQQYASVGAVETHFSPFWVKSVPSRPGATEVVVVPVH